jgi:hypothetical protein
LDLDDIGGDKDTIPSYALRQTPLSQESVLFGIITNLKKLHPDFVIIRATNPLDELFLARFLRKSYPQVRVVTIGADLLFQQQRDDALLLGTLAISSYSLRPDVDRYVPPVVRSQSEHLNVLTFPSTFSAGVYNAALSLLACKPQLSSPDSTTTCEGAPAAPYHEFGWSREWPENAHPDLVYNVARPSLWLLALGHDGYWPLARLNEKTLDEPSSSVATRTIPETYPTVQPKYSVPHHLTKDWTRFGLISVMASIAFCVLCWIGSADSGSRLISAFDKSPDPHRAAALTFAATILLVGVCGSLLPYVWIPTYDSQFLHVAVIFAFIPLVFCTLRTLDQRQAHAAFAIFVGICALVLFSILILYIWKSPYLDQLELFRMEHVMSGVSPALPVYLLLAAFLWCCWGNLESQALLDFRRPRLPGQAHLPDLKSILVGVPAVDLAYEGNKKLIRILLSPLSGLLDFCRQWFPALKKTLKSKSPIRKKLLSVWTEARTRKVDLWTTGRIALPVAFVLVVALNLLDAHHPINSLEGTIFDRAYAYVLALALFFLLTDLTRLTAGWIECRRLLRALEQLPLRRGFTEIKGFSWRPIWRLGAGPQRVLGREWESWRRYSLSQGEKDFGQPGFTINEQNAFFADCCAKAMTFLSKKWPTETDPPLKEGLQLNCCRAESRTERENDVEPAADVKAAEHFICLVYLNFILTVLLRLRILAFSAAGVYVLIVLSLASYPFEPRLGIRSFLILRLFSSFVVRILGYDREARVGAYLSRRGPAPVAAIGWLLPA